ncbi:MAG: HEPN domain-containing protein [Nitrospinae bacterium]|nr:HEPN domain-containing protein [Nitrospinota bacterium]
MNAPPDKGRLVRQWIEKAEHDLRTAEHTLTLKDDCPFDTVCFHAQQCAEKYLKGLLAFNALDFPKTHDLILLKNLAIKAGCMNPHELPLQTLNRYSIETRYPGEWEPITRVEAEEAVDLARKVRHLVRSSLPLDVID